MNIIEFTKKYIYEEMLMKGNIYFLTQNLLKIVAYYIIPIFLLIGTYIVITINNNTEYFAWSQFTARTAFFLLIFLLYLKPLMTILPNIGLIKKLMLFRRQFGITTFYFAFFHMINDMVDVGILGFPVFSIETLTWYKYGTISLAILLILYLTSNNYTINLLQRKWK